MVSKVTNTILSNMQRKVTAVDIVTSARNESANLKLLFNRIHESLLGSHYTWRLIISDNASSDDTWEVICELSELSNQVSGIRLSRDFGFEGSITAALSESTADVTIIMASDLQDAPERIPEFIHMYISGYDHVYQVVTKRPGTSRLRSFNSKVYYSIANKFSRGLITKDSSTYRLISGRMRDTLLLMPERNRYLRAMVNWIGFASIGIEFDREQRIIGSSKANSRHVIDYAVKNTLANSYYLLNFIAIFGFLSSLGAILLVVTFSFIWITKGVPFAGYGLLVGFLLLGFSIILLFLGILSQYISLMYEEIKDRPNYVISQKTN